MFIFAMWNNPDTYGEYNQNINYKTFFLNKEAKFYYRLGYYLYRRGYKVFDAPSIDLLLAHSPQWQEKYNELGGHTAVEEMMRFSEPENIDVLYDSIVKANTLIKLYNNPNLNILDNLNKFSSMTTGELQEWYEQEIDNTFINSNTDIKIETLEVTSEELDNIFKGNQMGLDYSANCPRLNYITMGIPKGELTMIGAHSGAGKTSYVFGNIVMPIMEQNIKCCIISNEQRSIDFKNLLLVYVLQKHLKVNNITRKHLKNGKLNNEQKQQILKAREIISEKYKDLKFVKLFENDGEKIKRIIKTLSKDGYELFIYDTMKSEDSIDTDFAMWQQLLQQSRNLFQLASKSNVAIVATYQLALHTLNKRFLNAMCLSNGKQIKEVFSEMIYFREIWGDEFSGEKYDIRPYDYHKDEKNKYSMVEIEKPLDRNTNGRYIVVFVDKTRNDEGRKQIVYRFNGAFNTWEEIAYCRVFNDHK